MAVSIHRVKILDKYFAVYRTIYSNMVIFILRV